MMAINIKTDYDNARKETRSSGSPGEMKGHAGVYISVHSRDS